MKQKIVIGKTSIPCEVQEHICIRYSGTCQFRGKSFSVTIDDELTDPSHVVADLRGQILSLFKGLAEEAAEEEKAEEALLPSWMRNGWNARDVLTLWNAGQPISVLVGDEEKSREGLGLFVAPAVLL